MNDLAQELAKSDKVHQPGSHGSHAWRYTENGTVVYGDHDPAAGWPEGVPLPDNDPEFLRMIERGHWGYRLRRKYRGPFDTTDRYVVEQVPLVRDHERWYHSLQSKPGAVSALDRGPDMWYNSDLAEVQTIGELGDAIQQRAVPKKTSGLVAELTDIEPDDQDAFLFRGLSSEEIAAIRRTNKLVSRNSGTIGKEEDGLTFFAASPATAAGYAGWFASYVDAPSPSDPCYVIKIRRPEKVAVERSRDDIGLQSPLPSSMIDTVYEGVVYSGEPRVWEMQYRTNNIGWVASPMGGGKTLIGWHQVKMSQRKAGRNGKVS